MTPQWLWLASEPEVLMAISARAPAIPLQLVSCWAHAPRRLLPAPCTATTPGDKTQHWVSLLVWAVHHHHPYPPRAQRRHLVTKHNTGSACWSEQYTTTTPTHPVHSDNTLWQKHNPGSAYRPKQCTTPTPPPHSDKTLGQPTSLSSAPPPPLPHLVIKHWVSLQAYAVNHPHPYPHWCLPPSRLWCLAPAQSVATLGHG